ncbi:phage tail protein [Lampropedia aestuarii]|uniref:Phage tail protein n=1 Tax=Lampropedia aestuarii TaxID=2562762 RepID=A0A4S5BFD7_9BURK|nr:phage tail tube protein [Lampropedia aestuarii]THJ30940.1 phage tail protein [Lampropedia aestuarii]
MAVTFPDGSVVGFATTISAAQAFSDGTNADPLDITATGLTEGSVIAVTSAKWPGLVNIATEVGAVDAGVAELLGIDTSDTTLYVPGNGAGQLVVASNFVDFSQQGELTPSGGEPQTYNGKYLENPLGQEFQIPIGQTARSSALTLDYDKELPWYKAAKAQSRKRQPTVIRITLPNGDAIYEWGYLHFNGSLPLTSGQPIKNTATFYFQSAEGTLVARA